MTEIRSAHSEDAQRIAQLASELGYPNPVDVVSSRVESVAGDPLSALLVAEEVGEVIGWVHVRGSGSIQSGPFAEVTGLVVAGTHRGTGIGGALIGAVESWASDHGYRSVRVRSRSTRKRTHDFYVGLGYDIVKEQVVFSKDL